MFVFFVLFKVNPSHDEKDQYECFQHKTHLNIFIIDVPTSIIVNLFLQLNKFV